ncbi:MAG TPA: GIY-YIG nuclease family protein [Abditibacteriaceae bacterium]|jgi:excinuclease ABC subunit C
MFDEARIAENQLHFSEESKPKVAPLRAFGAVRPRVRLEAKIDTRRRRKFKAQTREIPRCPGVYFFYGHKDRLLYIGKSKCLRERVRSYFADTSLPRPPRIKRILCEITRMEWRECGSELEALLLEKRLISDQQPLVNRQLKTFEVYPYLLLTDEAFPRLTFTRAEPVTQGADGGRQEAGPEHEEEELFNFTEPSSFDETKLPPASCLLPSDLENPPQLGEVPGFYLGPFTTAHAARWTLEAVRNIFPLRTCEGEMRPDPKGRACFYHEIKRCAGPCVGSVSQDDYARLCAELIQALESGQAPQIERLRARMLDYSNDWRFEEANELKLQLEALESVAARLGRLKRMRDQNNVIIVQPAKIAEDETPAVSLFLVRGGLVRRHFARVDNWLQVRETIREVYSTPLPSKPFTAKHELDEMMILDRWLNLHGQESCCVWLNDLSSRQWAVVASRKLEKWKSN